MGALVAVCVACFRRRSFTKRVRWCADAAVCGLAAAAVVYAWGGWKMFAWDIEETCGLQHGEIWDPAFAGESYFPLSKRCNANFDLVPSFVNPTIIVLLAASAALAVFACFSQRARKDPLRP